MAHPTDLVLGHPFFDDCDCDSYEEHKRRVSEVTPYTKELEILREIVDHLRTTHMDPERGKAFGCKTCALLSKLDAHHAAAAEVT